MDLSSNDWTKVQNSIDIARSVLSGKITNANILPQEIKTFADSMKLDEFQAKKNLHF